MFQKIKDFFGNISDRNLKIFLTVVSGLVILACIWINFVRPCYDKSKSKNVVTNPADSVVKTKTSLLESPIVLTPTTGLLTATAPTVPAVSKFVTPTAPAGVIKSSTQPAVAPVSAPVTKSTSTTKVLTQSVSVSATPVTTFKRDPQFENNPLFVLYDRIMLGHSTDNYFVEGVRRLNETLKGTPYKAFIKYEGGNAVAGLSFIQPQKAVEMKFGVYYGDSIWQELSIPGAEIHVTLGSSPCKRDLATVQEAVYTYFDCSGAKHEYPKKVLKK